MFSRIVIDGLSFALPLFVMTVGGIYSEKSGITNLALEGLQGVGAFCGALAAVLLMPQVSLSSQLPFYGALFMAMLGGMIYALLHACLCVKFKANQVISGVVINIFAVALTGFFTKAVNRNFFGTSSDRFVLNAAKRQTIPGLSSIPIIGAAFEEVYMFEVVIVCVTLLAWYVLYHTAYGLHLRACGDNPQAVDAAGMDVGKIRITAVMLSGAFSGLAGICFAYSILAGFSASIYMGYGYLAIAAMIFGNWRIFPSFGACLLFGFARASGYQFVQVMGISGNYSEVVMTFPYVLTLLLLVFLSKHTASPKALGESYEKGKR